MADVKLRWEGEGRNRIAVFEPQTKRGLRWLLERSEFEQGDWIGTTLVVRSDQQRQAVTDDLCRDGLEVN